MADDPKRLLMYCLERQVQLLRDLGDKASSKEDPYAGLMLYDDAQMLEDEVIAMRGGLPLVQADFDPFRCRRCGGAGHVFVTRGMGPDTYDSEESCPVCDGTGALEKVRLNLGSGRRSIPGYLNVDLSDDPMPDVRADVRDLSMFADGSVDECIAIHLLEHLYRWQAPEALREWCRVLRPGGRLILELPDLRKACLNALERIDSRAGVWGLYGDPSYRNELMVHRWGWQSSELTAELLAAGFSRVVTRDPQFHKKYRDMRIEATK